MAGYFITPGHEPPINPVFPRLTDDKLWDEFEKRTENMYGEELAKEMDAFVLKLSGIDEEGQI
jgi:hypothetical protein